MPSLLYLYFYVYIYIYDMYIYIYSLGVAKTPVTVDKLSIHFCEGNPINLQKIHGYSV